MSDENTQLLTDLKSELSKLHKRTNLILPRIPLHCGVFGNEKTDKLSKEASKNESEQWLKVIYQRRQRTLPRRREDHVDELNRQEQDVIFRLRTKSCDQKIIRYLIEMIRKHYLKT